MNFGVLTCSVLNAKSHIFVRNGKISKINRITFVFIAVDSLFILDCICTLTTSRNTQRVWGNRVDKLGRLEAFVDSWLQVRQHLSSLTCKAKLRKLTRCRRKAPG